MGNTFVSALVANLPPPSDGEMPQLNLGALVETQCAVDKCWGTRLAYRYCVERVRHLRKRHAMFGWLIKQPGVIWISEWHQLWADDVMTPLLKLFRSKPFALAYRWRAEPKWNELKLFFGQPENEDDEPTDGVTHNGNNIHLTGHAEVSMSALKYDDSTGSSLN
ncbi:hypothetical protein Salat_0508000 [Sesamum alatum]|uniref:Uncharacterized protein n=1 Tax=Sesamum alatum TaxID=300844 RepID=A0AAE1Z4E4_9LAMI|nr:hypothetical protein Salat_0508000 [Sesamum alatum]